MWLKETQTKSVLEQLFHPIEFKRMSDFYTSFSRVSSKRASFVDSASHARECGIDKRSLENGISLRLVPLSKYNLSEATTSKTS